MLSLDVIIIALLIWATQRTVGFDVCSQSEESCRKNTKDYSEFIGRYTFPTIPIETFECKSDEAITQIKKGVC
jgi:predicted RNA methylase